MPEALPTSRSSSKARTHETEKRYARIYSENPRLATDKEEEYGRNRFRRHEAEATQHSPVPVIRGSSETTPSNPSSSTNSSMRDNPRNSKHDANAALDSLGKVRYKLISVSKFRFLGRKAGHVRDMEGVNDVVRPPGSRGNEEEVLVSPPTQTPTRRSSHLRDTAEPGQHHGRPVHAIYASTPNAGIRNLGDQHEMQLVARNPSLGYVHHDRPQRVQQEPMLISTTTVLNGCPPSNLRPVDDEKSRGYKDGSDPDRIRAPVTSSSPTLDLRAENISGSPSVTPRMGRFGIYASPSPSIVEGTIPSPAPHRRWMPASPRPLDAGKVASPAPPTSPLRSPVKPPMHSLAAALTKTPKTPQARSLIDHTARSSQSEPQAQTSVEVFPTPRRRPLKQEEIFAIKLANRMSAFIPQTPHYASNPRLNLQRELTPIIDLSCSANNDDYDDGGYGSGTEEDMTPKAVGQNKDLHDNQHDVSQTDLGSADTKKPETQSQTSLSAFLSSAREMNENFVKSTSSAWDKLFCRVASNTPRDKGKNKEGGSSNPKASNADTWSSPTPTPEEVFDKTNAKDNLEGSRDIMLYSPLIPASNSIVELGRSEIVTLYSQSGDEEREKEDRAYRAELRKRWADGRGFVSFEALAREEQLAAREGDDDARLMRERARTMSNALQIDLGDGVDSLSASETAVERDSTTASPAPANESIPRERVVWKPSPTQLSVQVLWWGYRMYLPPPVLATLNAHSTSLTKRAALLTGALTWLLNNLPLDFLPPILAPAALLLRALVPLLGAIGTFISWSWRAIIMFDNGKGVVLSATWLLPVVLVPGTWDDVVEDTHGTAGRGEDGRELPVDYSTGGVQAFTTAVPRAGPSDLRARRENTL